MKALQHQGAAAAHLGQDSVVGCLVRDAGSRAATSTAATTGPATAPTVGATSAPAVAARSVGAAVAEVSAAVTAIVSRAVRTTVTTGRRGLVVTHGHASPFSIRGDGSSIRGG